MVCSMQCLRRYLVAGCALLLLVLLLVACGGKNNATGNSSNGASSANPVKQMAPTVTPTRQVTAAATQSALFKTYTGNGFTVQYPQNWKVTTSNTETAFTDPSGIYNLTIGLTPNPNGAKTADQIAESGIAGAKTNLKNVQAVDVPQTADVGGQSWSQRSISGTSTLNGQSSDVQAVVLANNHPNHTTDTKGYVLVYVAAKDQFEQAKTKYFQPMLESFKYTS